MRGVAVLVLLVSAAGCGSGTVTLSGTVTVGGKPLESGAVTVRGKSGAVVVGGVQDGRYEVGNVPAGVVKIAVTEAANSVGGGAAGAPAAGRTPPAPGKAAAAVAGKADAKSRIPPEYQDPDKSPITHDTATGTTKDIVIP